MVYLYTKLHPLANMPTQKSKNAFFWATLGSRAVVRLLLGVRPFQLTSITFIASIALIDVMEVGQVSRCLPLKMQ